MFCSNCGKQLPEGAAFCDGCGAQIIKQTVTSQQENSPQQPAVNLEGIKSNLANGVQKVKDNEFVKSVKEDIGNSASINIIKDKVNETADKVKTVDNSKKNKFKKIGIIAIIAIATITIVSNIHTCEECEEVYFGKEYTISFWGETENVCEDCYNDWYW